MSGSICRVEIAMIRKNFSVCSMFQDNTGINSSFLDFDPA